MIVVRGSPGPPIVAERRHDERPRRRRAELGVDQGRGRGVGERGRADERGAGVVGWQRWLGPREGQHDARGHAPAVAGRPQQGQLRRSPQAGGRVHHGAGDVGPTFGDVVDGLGHEEVAVGVEGGAQVDRGRPGRSASSPSVPGSAASTASPSQIRRPSCSVRSGKRAAEPVDVGSDRPPRAPPRGRRPRPGARRPAPARPARRRRAPCGRSGRSFQRVADGSLTARSRSTAAVSACAGEGAWSRPAGSARARPAGARRPSRRRPASGLCLAARPAACRAGGRAARPATDRCGTSPSRRWREQPLQPVGVDAHEPE